MNHGGLFLWILFASALTFLGCDAKEQASSVATQTDPTLNARSQGDSSSQMFAAIRQQEWEDAWSHAQPALVENPDDAEVVLGAARAASMLNRHDEMADLMVQACAMSDYRPPSLVEVTGKSLYDLGKAYRAIELFQNALKRQPDAQELRQRLMILLLSVGRNDLASEHIEPLIRAGSFDAVLLCAMTDLDTVQYSPEIGEKLARQNDSDQRVRLGKARHLHNTSQDEQAIKILERALKQHAELTPAHALYGQVLSSTNQLDKLPHWYRNKTKKSVSDADFWLTLGDWATALKDLEGAMRSYWQASQLAPNKILAWDRLAKAARQIRESNLELSVMPNDAQLQAIDRRAADLQEIRQAIKAFRNSRMRSQREAVHVTVLLTKLGRYGEANAWCQLAEHLDRERIPEFAKVKNLVADKLTSEQIWEAVSEQPARLLDLSSLSVPRLSESVPIANTPSISISESGADARLEDSTARWQLSDVGGKSNPGNVDVMPLERSLGVGGGTIDYDLDGLPDIVIAGAGGAVQAIDSQANKLLRNIGERFAGVTQASGVDDRHFGQGIAVGDFNEDGLPDLFYANFGTNTLLANNGDGTFRQVNALLQDKTQQWTTCGAFVDLDQDGLTDLLTTNYCDALETINQPCLNEQGVAGPCHPLKFKAHRDVFFRSNGDGSMANVTSRWKPELSPGRGLGILAGSLQPEQQSVYVANDMTANEFISLGKESDQRSTDGPLSTDTARLRGIAFSGMSQPQASMGIASGDIDLDGDLDLFVTGFANEHHILYEQTSPGYWVDASSRLGLTEPTVKVVGFGTEAIDLDNDGWLELLVTNGHITEFGDKEVPLRQPFQVFRRGSKGKFQLVDDDTWGEYFASDHIGRSLWTIDANVDGLTDVLVTHTYEPAKLLINQTQTANKQIEFQLVGTNCSRDAVGAVITFSEGGRQRRLWRSSGDGFMCSNEPILRAGMASSSKAKEVSVRWPDGSTEHFGTLDAGNRFLLIQGQADSFRLR